MASSAISAQGTTIAIGATPTVIENVISFSGFDGEASEIDITNLSSQAKENLVGLTDNGSFSFEYHPNYLVATAGQEALRAAALSGATTEFLLTLKDLSTIGFNAVVKNAMSASGGVDAALSGSASLKISGVLTITPPP
jgi:hypothetical protein